MRRLLFYIATLLCAAMILCVPAVATEPAERLDPEHWGVGLSFVCDTVQLLDEQERSRLLETAQQISADYQCHVYIITLDDFRRYTNGDSIEQCAEDIRTGYALGQGEDKNCIALVLSMAERDYDVVIHGAYARAVFTGSNLSWLIDSFLDEFRGDNWYDGFAGYMDGCNRLLAQSVQGTPIQRPDGDGQQWQPAPIQKRTNVGSRIAGSFLLALPIAFVYCMIQKKKMRAVAEQTKANEYVPAGGCEITYRADRYMGTTVNRVYSPRQTNSGGGAHSGGGVHVHSSGKF